MRVLIALLAAAVLAAVPHVEKAAAQCTMLCPVGNVVKHEIPADLRNVRYCEILTMKRHGLTMGVTVYNTLGLNFCPEAQWKALNEKALAKAGDFSAVRLNGPRYWTINAIKASGDSKNGETWTFGGIAMTARATIELKLWQLKYGGYRVNQIKRNTVYTYKKGAQVYELTSPKGDVYMMQSYAQIVDPKLTIADLPNLGQRLKLPKGWKYQTRTLDADYELKADGVAYLVQDDLYNSYQRRPK